VQFGTDSSVEDHRNSDARCADDDLWWKSVRIECLILYVYNAKGQASQTPTFCRQAGLLASLASISQPFKPKKSSFS